MSTRSKEVDSLFSEWDKDDSPGCMLAVIKDGEMLYERGYGLANLEHRIPITSKSVFRIGSMSKQFTAMCIAILAEKKLLSLDDGICKYIPELPEYAESITIRHMVHHTSGIRSYTDLLFLSMLALDIKYADHITKEEVLEMIVRQRNPKFEPGERYDYSNSNYYLLGLIVERVSGKTLREFADENIFGPLGMEYTHYHDDCKMVVKNRAYGYTLREDGKFEILMSNNEVVGDGAVFTTVDDLLLWDRNFYESKLPGGEALIKTIETVGVLNSGEPHTYAFGLVNSEYRGLPMISHGGAWAGFHAFMARFPEQRLSVITLANVGTVPAQSLALSVASLFLEKHIEDRDMDQPDRNLSKATKFSKKKLDELAGMYRTPYGSLIEVSREESGLSVMVVGWRESRTIYTPVSKTEFRPTGGALTGSLVVQITEENQTQFVFHQPTGQQSKWVPIPGRIPSDEMDDFTGHYHSKELDSKFQLKKTENATLVCVGPCSWSDEFELHKLATDELLFLTVQIRFRRNKKKQVIGFDMFLPLDTHAMRFRKMKST
ncbi:MAG: beta-lactamase family protein [Candidatus Thorarchaeota archaeon]|nr:MAG: beta-lactamase family protein [Candidatus Thorarchaeota archaeon]